MCYSVKHLQRHPCEQKHGRIVSKRHVWFLVEASGSVDVMPTSISVSVSFLPFFVCLFYPNLNTHFRNLAHGFDCEAAGAIFLLSITTTSAFLSQKRKKNLLILDSLSLRALYLSKWFLHFSDSVKFFDKAIFKWLCFSFKVYI